MRCLASFQEVIDPRQPAQNDSAGLLIRRFAMNVPYKGTSFSWLEVAGSSRVHSVEPCSVNAVLARALVGHVR